MKNINQTKQIMHPITFQVKAKKIKKPYKPQLHDFIYIILCIFIVIGFADNVERFIKASVTPRIVEAQHRIDTARQVLLNGKIISPVSAAYAEPTGMPEIKNPFNPKSPKGIAWKVNKERFGIEHWGSFEELINNESGWNPYAKNANGGACGLGQALPCEKMNCEQWDYECQVNWVADYIADRYKNPIAAWDFWQTLHEVNGEMVHYY